MTTENTAIEVFNPRKFTETLTLAPSVLEANKTSVARANDAGKTILDTIEASGMSDDLDAACNDFQVKVKKTYDTMQERRKPITQLLDEVKKQFTSMEAEIDPKNPASYFAKVQTYRNNYAQKKLEEQKKREAEARVKLEKEKEIADYRAKCEVAVSNHFNTAITRKLQEISELLNSSTLETIDDNAKKIIAFSEEYPQSYHAKAVVTGVFYMHIKQEDMDPVLAAVITETFPGFNKQYEQAIRSAKDELTLKVPAKRSELNELALAAERKAKADAELKAAKDEESKKAAELAAEQAAAEQARIEQEKADREKADKEKADKEAADRAAEAERQAESNKQAAQMNSLFDAASESQAPVTTAKEAYEIEVLNPAGYLLLAQFWFEKEGLKATHDEIEKKTFKQIKAFCEKWALKNEEFVKSPFINYKEVAKATVKK